jgi:high-affinity nickel-transport protein
MKGLLLRVQWPVAVAAGLQMLAWGLGYLVCRDHPTLWGLCGLAYVLGLRHGFDADHIVVIDNVSRTLIGRGVRPVGLGLYFALGHSSVIAAASLLAAIAVSRANLLMGRIHDTLGAYTTVLSVALVLLVAPRNLMAARSAYRSYQRHEEPVPPHTGHGGWLARRVERALRGAQLQTWHMFPMGVLFGLGFETATAVAVLGLTAQQSAGGAAVATVAVYPLLFAAGMTCVDLTDAMLMERAYGWALREPQRHALYNLAITGLSGLTAVCVGSLELIWLFRSAAASHEDPWWLVDWLEAHFDLLGAAIVAVLLVVWAGASACAWWRPGDGRRQTL